MGDEHQNLVPVSACLHPFKARHDTVMVVPGTTLDTALAAARLDPALWGHDGTRVFVNDLLVDRAHWGSLTLRDGDLVAVRVLPASGETVRLVAMVAIMVVAAVVNWWNPGGYGMLLAAGVMIAGSLAVNLLIPVQPPELSNGDDRGAQSYTIRGVRNVADPYGPITRIYGKHRVYPKYAAMPYTELVGSDQYLRCLFLIGKGRYHLTEHKIGETAIEDFEEIDIRKYDTAQTETYRLFPNDVYEDPLSIELTQAGGWQTRSTQTGCDEISIDLTFPYGLTNIEGDGDRVPKSVSFSVEYAPFGTTDWEKISDAQRLVFAFNDGEPSTNIAVGHTIVGLTSGAEGVIKYTSEGWGYVDGPVDELGNTTQVLTWYTATVRVEITNATDFVAEDVEIDGGTYTATIERVGASTVLVTDDTLAQKRYGIAWEVERGQYTVRVKRLTADDGPNDVDDSYWTALRSISFETPVTAEDVTLVAVRIKATGQLSGVLDQYNCLAEAILPVYDGTEWRDVKTRNPAWAFCDVLMGESNVRPVTASRIDLAAMVTWATNCATAGRTFDIVLDSKRTVWETLRLIATVGRASPGLIDNDITVIEDKTQTVPVQHFSPRNSWDFTGRKVFPDMPHALKIRFMNAAKDYVQDERIVYDDGYTSANATRFETLDLFGATSSGQVWKWGRYVLASMRLRPEVYELTADVENIVCTRGDLVRLTHDVLSVGLGQGRIKSYTVDGANIATITVDDIFPMELGGSYGIRIRKATGTSVTATVATAAGDNLVLTLTSVLASSGIAAGDMIFYGEADSESIEVLVNRIDPGPDLTARLTLIPYNSAILTADSGDIPAWDSNITLPPEFNRTPPKPSIASQHYSYSNTRRNDDGSLMIWLVFTWDVSATSFGRTIYETVRGFEIQYRVDDGAWISLSNRPASARQQGFAVQDGFSYDIRIRSFSLPGLYSGWDTESNVVIDLERVLPPVPTGLQVVGGGTAWETKGCAIEWTEPTSGGNLGPIIEGYIVEIYTSADELIRTRYITGNKYTYSYATNNLDGAGTPRAVLKFRVYSRNKWGELSATYASLTATNSAPSAPANIGAVARVNAVEFYWDANTEKDFRYYTFRFKAGSEAWEAWSYTSASKVTRKLTSADLDNDRTIYIEVKSIDFLGGTSAASDTSADSDRKNDDKSPDNVILNPSFEIARSNVAKAKNWSITAVREATGGNVSNAYVKVTRAGGVDEVAYGLNNDNTTIFYIPVEPGSAYEWGGDIKSEDGSVNGRIALYQRDKDKAAISSAVVASTSASWTSKMKRTRLSATTRYIYFGIQANDSNGWAAFDNLYCRKIDTLSDNWRKVAIEDTDEMSIDGEKIHVQSAISINDATYGNEGIQLQYNAGTPRFYCGDGSNNYIKFTGANAQISSSLAYAIIIKSGGSIKIEEAGDLVMSNVTGSGAEDRSMIKFLTTGSTNIVISADYDNKLLAIFPSADGAGNFDIGYNYTEGFQRFNNIYFASNGSSILRALYGASVLDRDARFQAYVTSTYAESKIAAHFQNTEDAEDNAIITCYSSDASNYIDMIVTDDGAGGSDGIRLTAAAFRARIDSTMALGSPSICWSNIYGDAGVTACSDRKYKTAIEPTPLGLDFIMALAPVSFEWDTTCARPKNHPGKYHGLIAPEVEQALLDVGYTQHFGGIEIVPDEQTGEPWYGLQYEQFIAPMIKAIQQLSEKIKKLEAEKVGGSNERSN